MASRARNGYVGAVLLCVVFLTTFTTSAMAQCSPAESAALIKFKSAFNDPRGDLHTWNEGGNCCGWKGIQCSRSGVGAIDLTLDPPQGQNSPAFTINYNNPQAGTIAGEALAELSQLVILRTNWVIWDVPLPLLQLSKLSLREIVIRNGRIGNRNSPGGALQNDIASFANSLEVLILTNTKINIGLPSNLCKLTKLRVLEVAGSLISNVGPACLGSVGSLQEVRVHSNPKVTGGLPVWPASLPNLKVLDFSNNAHSGNIPVQFGKLGNTELFLGGNHLAGKIPPGLSGKTESTFRPGNYKLCGAPLPTCPV